MNNAPKSSEITPKELFYSRRQFLKTVGLAAGALAGASILAGCAPGASPTPAPTLGANSAAASAAGADATAVKVDELGDPANEFEAITNYNNFYEFSTDKQAVAPRSKNFVTSPWQVQVGGLVNKPGVFDIDALRKFDHEERIYRLRCVEAWSMVIPWWGFPLRKLLEQVEPTSAAKYVRFETLYDPGRMPGQNSAWYQWPYVEGLRMDEAMNDLAILATGLYGEDLLPQSGAPVRMVVPWKYGFKSIKSIVKIDLVEEQPTSLWMAASPQEYGFYANVNPDVDHPRWSQRSERRIGELGRRETLPFNGYGEQVAQLYAGMDLRANF